MARGMIFPPLEANTKVGNCEVIATLLGSHTCGDSPNTMSGMRFSLFPNVVLQVLASVNLLVLSIWV